MESTTQPRTSSCPECCASVPIAVEAVENEIVPCPDCGAELEITGLEPLTVELAPEVEEDWGE